MKKGFRVAAAASSILIAAAQTAAIPTAHAAYGVGGNGTAIMEYLDRGIYAVKSGNGMFVSWRWNANDADNAEFRLYRDGNLIFTSKAGSGATGYQDNGGNARCQQKLPAFAGEIFIQAAAQSRKEKSAGQQAGQGQGRLCRGRDGGR